MFKKNHARREKSLLTQLEHVIKAARKRREKTVPASKRTAQKFGVVVAMVGVLVVYSCYSVMHVAYFTTTYLELLTLSQDQGTQMIIDAILTAIMDVWFFCV